MVMYTHLTLKKDGSKARGAPPRTPPTAKKKKNGASRPVPLNNTFFPTSRHQSPV
ncbi:unnamed protein product, partial [Ectocarpus sp. 6 AP-2014]